MKTLKSAALLGAVGALALSTGCTAIPGMILGSQLFGDQNLNPFLAPGMSGNAVVCLGVDDPSIEAGQAVYEFAGELAEWEWTDELAVGFDNLIPCWTDVTATMEVTDDAGATWTVGYAWLDGSGWDMTPTVWSDSGQVEVTVRSVPGTEAAGMVVREGGEMIYAMEAGRDASALQDGDVPGVSIRTQAASGFEITNNGCGDLEMNVIEFESGNDRLVLYPGEDEWLDTEEGGFTTCSIESVEVVDDDGCEAAVSEVSWVMF